MGKVVLDVRGFFWRLLMAMFGLGFCFGRRRGKEAGDGPLAVSEERRRRFRRRLREALDELLADPPATDEPTA